MTAHDRLVSAALRTIPAGTPVSATNALGAHLSARTRILSFPVVAGARWLAVDETSPSYLDRAHAPVLFRRALTALLVPSPWRTVVAGDGILVVRRR